MKSLATPTVLVRAHQGHNHQGHTRPTTTPVETERMERTARVSKKPPLPCVPIAPPRPVSAAPSTQAPAGSVAAQAQAMLREAAQNKGYIPEEWHKLSSPADGEVSLASLALKARVPPLEELGLRRAPPKPMDPQARPPVLVESYASGF